MSAISLCSSGNTEVPQTGQSPLLFSIRSEHTHFLLGATAGAACALARSQEREDKHCKVECVLTRVRSRRNRDNNRKMPALSERLPSCSPQKLPVTWISWFSKIGFEPEAVDANLTFPIFSPLSHAGALSCCLARVFKLPEKGFSSPGDFIQPLHPCLCFSHRLPRWPQG